MISRDSGNTISLEVEESEVPTVSFSQDDLIADGLIIAERFQVIEPLGKGGVGAVFKVRHLQLDRVCALKVLQTQNVSSDSILRFQHEARVISSLRHPNIVAVVDFGVTSAGQPYMLMELVEGVPLSHLIKDNLPVERLARIFRQVCDALAYAHEANIVHRDIKPSNIIVTPKSDGTDHVTVVDFGLAKNMAEDSRNTPNLTKTGDVFGTPSYMSPEQCLGQELDGRADIYSLGCVMYELFTGHPPFEADSMFEIIYKQISEPPLAITKPRMNSRERLFEVILLRAMAKQVQDRYQFALQMAGDLKRVEVQRSSWVSDISAAANVMQSRIRAGSKGDAWWTASAQVMILLSLIFFYNLWILQEPMKRDSAELLRESELLGRINDLSSSGFQKDILQGIENQKEIFRTMASLVTDPKERQVFEELNRPLQIGSYLTARTVSTLKTAARTATEMEGFNPQILNVFKEAIRSIKNLQEMGHSWVEYGAKYAEFHTLVAKNCMCLSNKLSEEYVAFSVSKWGGVLVLIALASLIAIKQRGRHSRKKSAEALSRSIT